MQNNTTPPHRVGKHGPEPLPLHQNPILAKLGCNSTVVERLWKKVSKTETCWLWTGSKSWNGYGVIGAGRIAGGMLTHRLSWLIHFGEIPEGKKVLHNCPGGDNRACCNPAHLWLGTILENQQDMAQKGRSCLGEKATTSKLTNEQVLEIRKLWAEGNLLQTEIAERFGVGSRAISKIVLRQRWPHI